MRLRVPFAYSLLLHQRRRLALYACGVALSVVIMFTEFGFYNGLNDSQSMLPTLLNADLVMLHRQRTHLLNSTRFDKMRLAMAASVEGVETAVPLYEGFTTLRNPQTGRPRKIYVYAFPPGQAPLRIPALNRLEPQIHLPGTVVFDKLARPIYGEIHTDMTVLLELNRLHRIAGLIALGPNISYDGYLFMSDRTWMALGNGEEISMGLIRAEEGVDIMDLRDRVVHRLPDDVVLMTPEEIRLREVDFTTSASPSGIVFGIGLAMGLVVGIVICYQILFQLIMDQQSQYAVMTAMGFTDRLIAVIIVRQALILSVIGFLPGLLLSAGLYGVIERYTHIIMDLTPGRAAFVLLLTSLMAAAGGLLAASRLRRVDPADLFE